MRFFGIVLTLITNVMSHFRKKRPKASSKTTGSANSPTGTHLQCCDNANKLLFSMSIHRRIHHVKSVLFIFLFKYINEFLNCASRSKSSVNGDLVLRLKAFAGIRLFNVKEAS